MTVPITVLRMVPIQRYRHFFANSYLQMFVFHHFLPQKQAFLSPEVPEGQKRDKKYVPRSARGTKKGQKIRPSSAWGTNEGQN